MMSGNKFFRQPPVLMGQTQEYVSKLCPLKVIKDDSKIESKFNNQLSTIIEERELEMKSPISEISDLMHKQDNVQIESKQEIRMQEIEEFILSNSIVRKINGNLCMWNGNYYKQVSLQTFTTEVRSILPRASQKKISRFSRFKEAYEYMQANTDINQFSEKELAQAKKMIVFQNTIYEGSTGRLLHKSSSYPVIFDIDAKYIDSDRLSTPCFDKIINHATGNDKNALKLCYQILGYIFSQGNDAKKFFVFGTAPDSGKSIIGEFVAKILGRDNVSTIALSEFGAKFALGTINQKVLNYNMDLPATELDKNSIQKLKQLTGDPRIECEEKYVQGKTVVHHCKFLFATNHPIKLKYEDSAFYNRLILVPFIYSVGEYERDYDLLSKLWEERHAIATKAAHAYTDLLNNNYIFQKTPLADMIISEWKEQDERELLRQFLCRNFEIADNDSFVPTDTIFRMYQNYCREQGVGIIYQDKNQFSRKFHEATRLAVTKRRAEGFASSVNGYVGIKICKI